MFVTRMFEASKSAKISAQGNLSRKAVHAVVSAMFVLAVMLPMGATAQANNLGSANIGSISSASPLTVTVPFTLAGSGKLGGISVVTGGKQNGDFSNTSAGSCSTSPATSVTVGGTCTVTVRFTPQQSGVRNGAVVLSDSAGLVVGTAYLQGFGKGAKLIQPSAPLVTMNMTMGGSSFTFCDADSLAVDGNGNIFVADSCFNGATGDTIYKATPTVPGGSNYTVTALPTCSNPSSPAPTDICYPITANVDGAGNLYGGTSTNGPNAVDQYTLQPNGSYLLTNTFYIPITNSYIGGIAIDGSGNVYITDGGAGIVYMETLQTNGTYVQSTIATGLNSPWGAAVDANGNVFIEVGDGSAPLGNDVVELVAANSYAPTTINNTLSYANDFKIDGNGNLFLDSGFSAITELQNNGGGSFTALTLASTSSQALGIDSNGDFFSSDGVNLYEVPYGTPSMSFATTAYDTLSSDSPQTLTLENIGNQSVTIPASLYAADFIAPTPTNNSTCLANSIAVDASCSLIVDFMPTTVVATSPVLLSEQIALGASGMATTNVQVSGQETALPQTINWAQLTATPPLTVYTGNPPIALPIPTSATSGISPVVMSVLSGPGYINGSNQLVIIGEGIIVVAVNEAAAPGYAAAPELTQEVVVLSSITLAGETALGTEPIGVTSTSVPVSITFVVPTTLGKIAVLTQGATGLDFNAVAGAGSCVINHAYAASTSCTVYVTFKPKVSGPRYGAVVLSDVGGNILGTGYLQGTGLGAQVTYSPQTLEGTTLDTSGLGSINQFIDPDGMAIDASGNIYIADECYNNLYRVKNGCYIYKLTPTLPIGSGNYKESVINASNGVDNPLTVAVDGAGNVYATSGADWWVGDLLEPQVLLFTLLPNGTYAPGIPIATFSNPSNSVPGGVTVDGSGNVYVTDNGNGANGVYGSVYKLTLSGGNYTQTTIASGASIGHPWSAAVDGNGNVYFSSDLPAVIKLTAQSSYAQSFVGSGWGGPGGLKVDGNGNLYVSDNGNIVKATVQSDGTTYLSSVLVNGTTAGIGPCDLAVDGSGNLFISDCGNNAVEEMPYATPLGPLNFASTPEGLTSSDSPQTVTVDNFGNSQLTFSTLSYAADFPEAAGVVTDCSSSANVQANNTCTLSVDFTPVASGWPQTLTEDLLITTNDLNTPTNQPIVVTGQELAPLLPQVITFTDSLPTTAPFTNQTYTISATGGGSGNPVTFTVTGGSNFLFDTVTNNLTILGASATPIVVTANQAGSATYNPAPTVTQQIVITAADGLGEAGNDNLGSVNVGSTSTVVVPVTLVTSGVTLGNITVSTQGIANLDYTFVSSTGCTSGQTLTAGTYTCNVSVKFAPIASGPRNGAIVIYNNLGKIIATEFLAGIGVGPQTNFSPQALLTPTVNGASYGDADGLAIDAAGNLYVADENYTPNSFFKLRNNGDGTYTESTIDGSVPNALNIAIDGAGNVYGTSGGNWGGNCTQYCTQPQVFLYTLLPGGGYSPRVDLGQFIPNFVNSPNNSTPGGVAVDAAGNVYVADNGVGDIYELTPQGDGTYVSTTVVTGLNQPFSITVDTQGNLYTGSGAPVLTKIPYSGGSYGTPVSIGTGWAAPNGVKVDGNGNVYVADGNGISKLTPSAGSYTQTLLNPTGQGDVAVDGNGNVFAVIGNVLSEIAYATPSGPLAFASTPEGQVSSPQTVVVSNFGNASLNFSSVAYPADFVADASSTCTGTTDVAQNGTCNLSIDFAPVANGWPQTLTEDVNLFTNNLNGTNVEQQIQVSGQEIAPLLTQTITFTDALPSSVNYTVGLSYTISATASSGLPVTFTVTGGSNFTFNSGTNLLTILGASGTPILVTANQAGNATYAAVTATQSILINAPVNNPTTQTIVFTDSLPATVPYSAGLTYPISAIGGGSGNPVTFTVTGPGTLTTIGGVLTLTVTGQGTIVVSANQAGNVTYAAAQQVQQSVVVTALGTTAVPTFSVPSGAYGSMQTVQISDVTPGALIYYTTDGVTLPTPSATLYTGSITVSSNETIMAIAVAPGYFASSIATATYIVNNSAVDFTINATGATVAVLPPGGSDQFTFSVTPGNGAATFANAINLSLSGLPAGITYTFSPVSIAAGAGATTVHLTITWPAISSVKQPAGVGGILATRLAPLSLALLLLPFVGRMRRAGKKLSRTISVLMLLVAALAATAGLSGCGSSNGFFSQAQKNYAVVVTASSGAYTSTTTITLTVE